MLLPKVTGLMLASRKVRFPKICLLFVLLQSLFLLENNISKVLYFIVVVDPTVVNILFNISACVC